MLLTVGAGIGLIGCTSVFIFEEIKKKKSSKAIETEHHEQPKDYTTPYTQLFTNLGLMDAEKGDWIECYGIENYDCYRLVKFKLSDTISYNDFKKKSSQLAEKIQIQENHFSIYAKDGYMYFKIRHEELPTVPYKFEKTPNHIIPLGIDLDHRTIVWDVTKDPHLICVGSTGSGKSTLVNMIINHIMLNQNGGELYLIDLKRGLEFGEYENTKGCIAYAETLEDAKQVIAQFSQEAERRYAIMKEKGHRNYNKFIKEYPNSFPRAYLIVDEFAELMTTKKPKKGEYDVIEELTQLAKAVRAVGLSIVISTQRPTADSIPPTMKANMQGMVCFRVINELNSRIALDEQGAELLEPRHCIGILEGKKTYFRTMYFDEAVISETCKKYNRPNQKDPIQLNSYILDSKNIFK